MSEQLVIGSVALAVIDTSIANLRKTNTRAPAMKVVVGGFVVAVSLLILSEANEDLADTVAIIILLSTLFGPSGGALTSVIDSVTKGTNTAPSVKQPPTDQTVKRS